MSTARDDRNGHTDPAGVGVSLAAEAALLEARLRMLSEALHEVDTRIRVVSDSLYKLRNSAPARDDEKRSHP
ncbi:hypothetical protein [Streptomyces sp. CB02400]|uniref:hypothetical protein n=1 Tax=Streptomyces sp. CB02400 TaxID=1703944 RepID=UPI0009394AC3|nr:hypothetical protein [Streptomyces sp. CB02400]OKK05048.1 hypothetical protein AMK33_22875 [Streptomyces sp. CB02400]